MQSGQGLDEVGVDLGGWTIPVQLIVMLAMVMSQLVVVGLATLEHSLKRHVISLLRRPAVSSPGLAGRRVLCLVDMISNIICDYLDWRSATCLRRIPRPLRGMRSV